MNKMTTQIETIVNAYKSLSKIPAVLSGKLIKNGRKITSKWSVRNLDKGRNTKYLYNYVLNDSLDVIAESEFGIDVSNELLSAVSPRETFKAVIREEKEGKEGKKQYLEVWRKNYLVHSIDLTALDIHGDVYADSEFGCLDWSQDETALVYVAEKKLPKSEPYIKRKAEDKPKTNGSGETAPKKGEEYLYRQDWGEQLVGKHLSVAVVCRLQTETCSVLEGLPESWCPGQVRFSPDGQSVVGVAWETQPRRLGLIFCTNRASYIFHLSLDGNMKKLSGEGLAVRSPRFAPNGDLVWLQRPVGGPHHACHALVRLNRGETTVRTLVNIVDTEVEIAGGEKFHGLYCLSLPARCFSADGKRLVLSTPQQLEVKTYVVDLEDGHMTDISYKAVSGSTSILDVASDMLLATFSNMTTPGQLYVARLPPAGSSAVEWTRVSEQGSVPAALSASTVRYMQLAHDNQDSVKSFSALYLSPKAEGKVPLIVWPHGGPHSSFVNAYGIESALFSLLGLASLQINYRGSTGAGDTSLRFLPKRVGSADVADCKLATDEAVRQFNADERRLALVGGSHGGFLVTHLSGQYPDTYKAVVTRNPVTDCSSMFNSTDIADWVGGYISSLLTEAGGVCKLSDEAVRQLNADERRLALVGGPTGGLASVRINFRGSTGYGDANVRCLLAHGGDYDVADCHLAIHILVDTGALDTGALDTGALDTGALAIGALDTGALDTCALDTKAVDTGALDAKSFNRTPVMLNGGSYGGFVAAHLAGRYPDMFKAMVMRNPLVDLATKGHYADNSDGCAVEAGYEFTEEGPVSDEQLLAMRRCSPMAHVHKVKAPTAMLLGAGDKRVPHYQGLEYARRLQANGVHTRIYMYDDNHSLSSLPAEMDNLVNSANWFLDHLRS